MLLLRVVLRVVPQREIGSMAVGGKNSPNLGSLALRLAESFHDKSNCTCTLFCSCDQRSRNCGINCLVVPSPLAPE